MVVMFGFILPLLVRGAGVEPLSATGACSLAYVAFVILRCWLAYISLRKDEVDLKRTGLEHLSYVARRYLEGRGPPMPEPPPAQLPEPAPAQLPEPAPEPANRQRIKGK
jgi:hypothetical protein